MEWIVTANQTLVINPFFNHCLFFKFCQASALQDRIESTHFQPQCAVEFWCKPLLQRKKKATLTSGFFLLAYVVFKTHTPLVRHTVQWFLCTGSVTPALLAGQPNRLRRTYHQYFDHKP